MTGKSVPLFRIFGFNVRIRPSWLLLVALIVWSLAVGVFPREAPRLSPLTYWIMGLAGALGLFFSILVHELSHSLVGRHYGMKFGGISLFLLGGIAEAGGEALTPRAELRMAAIGPVVSLAIGMGFYGLVLLGLAGDWPVALTLLCSYLSDMNLLIAAFNMVPAFPLDGGRVLRALLWHWKKDIVPATKVAARIGAVFGIALMLLGVLTFLVGNFIGGLWWLLIGTFIRGAARISLDQTLLTRGLEGKPVEAFLTPEPVRIPPHLTLQKLVDDYFYVRPQRSYPVTDGDRWVGSVHSEDLSRFPPAEWSRRTVAELVRSRDDSPTIGPREDAATALTRMQEAGTGLLWVTDGERLVGRLSMGDLLDRMAIRRELDEHRRAA